MGGEQVLRAYYEQTFDNNILDKKPQKFPGTYGFNLVDRLMNATTPAAEARDPAMMGHNQGGESIASPISSCLE